MNVFNTLTVANSTFSGHPSGGSALFVAGGTTTIRNSTFQSASTSTTDGDALYVQSVGTLMIQNTVFAGHEGGSRCAGQTNSIAATASLSTDASCPGFTQVALNDLHLGTLGDNGGFTETIALLTGSVAIDGGDNTTCTESDQRGASRPVDGDTNGSAVCDVGAFEYGGLISGSLTGQVTLQGRPAPPHPSWSVPLSVSLTSGEQLLFDNIVVSDQGGIFTVGGLTPGDYELRVKHNHSLSCSKTISIAAGMNNVTIGTLREGDANDDDSVNIVDFSILAVSFGLSDAQVVFDARADFNEDGVVSISDFSLLAANFAVSGGTC
ncbi:MAG: hypothetical protein IPK19_42190 [Chloroflexi bacterium]|nr:hypothetical protein [Chloroflexota bacterium]